MRTCPSCGVVNADDATTCILCGRALVPVERPEELAFAAASSPPEPEQPAPAAPPPPTAQPVPPPPPTMPATAATPTRPAIVPHPRFSRAQWRKRYLLGLGLGFIPVLIALACVGTILTRGTPTIPVNIIVSGVIAASVLYIAVFIGMIVCLSIDRLRPIGYGLLTMVVAGPIIVTASCFGAIALASRQTG